MSPIKRLKGANECHGLAVAEKVKEVPEVGSIRCEVIGRMMGGSGSGIWTDSSPSR